MACPYCLQHAQYGLQQQQQGLFNALLNAGPFGAGLAAQQMGGSFTATSGPGTLVRLKELQNIIARRHVVWPNENKTTRVWRRNEWRKGRYFW